MSPARGAPLLSVERLSVVIDLPHERVRAVRDVSLDVCQGETVALVGETGSGKTMTALSLMRLIQPPARITGGSIRFVGNDLLALSERELRRIRGREISMIFQNPQASLNPMFRIETQMVEAIRVHGRESKAEARERAGWLLSRLRLHDPGRVLRAYPHELSGGACQRVMTALAILSRPKLLIADEPTTALDTITQAHILGLLQSLKGEFVSAILLITHDLKIVHKITDRTVVLRDGSTVETRATNDLFASPREPYTRTLVEAARMRMAFAQR
jgi:ABC-type dipeptide/oligopeptide/nickel transport system ATPase component